MLTRKVILHGYIKIIYILRRYISSHEFLFVDKISITSTLFIYMIFKRVSISYEKFINCNQNLYILYASYQFINDY